MRIALSLATFASMTITATLKRATDVSSRVTLALADALNGAPRIPPPLSRLDREYFEEVEAAE